MTQAAHEALGGEPETRPLVVDPFAGGGSIPLEALRVGADAFASDLNPIPVLLNKVVLEYIPKYGQRLADEVRKWGAWIKQEAEKELAEFYPKDPDGATPIAYLWARTIQCEGPGCGAEVPLLGNSVIAYRKNRNITLSLNGVPKTKRIEVGLFDSYLTKPPKRTCKGFIVTCPRTECGYSTPKKNVQHQLTAQQGGADTSRLVAILTDGENGRSYRLPITLDIRAFEAAKAAIKNKVNKISSGIFSAIPDEPIPAKTAHRAVGSQLPLYGFKSWGDLFNSRQKLAIIVLQHFVKKVYPELARCGDEQFAHAVFLLLSFAIDKQTDYSSSLCRWVSRGEFIAGTLAGEKKFPMISDFAESNPIGSGSGSWANQIDWIVRFLEREGCAFSHAGTVCQSSADERALPNDAAAAMITDPPYYDSVPYADLSDYFYVWLQRTVHGIEHLSEGPLTPKEQEMTVNHPGNQDEKARYESLLTGAFNNGRNVTATAGIAVIVFAHKSTSGWETLLEAIIKSGWIITASWPIDTERIVRLNALNTASLTSSVHLVCRPRKTSDSSLQDNIGDWRDVLAELPQCIHEWMPRLAEEGIVGADAIFACLGPALEIFSHYSRVEKSSGEAVTLKEYLEYVWAAVSKEALSMIFKDPDTAGLEPDARLTAMWLWTLGASSSNASADDSEESEEDSDEDSSKAAKVSGFTLEFDAARRIAQGLGVHLEKSPSVVEVKGDTAKLLSVAERVKYLFGKDAETTVTGKTPRKKKQPVQQSLFAELQAAESAAQVEWGDVQGPKPGITVLDRLHQAMVLFAAGRGEAMKRFLVEEGIGNDARFWKLAQSLTALYPGGSDEKRWVDGVLARKKGLGF